jgi:hypothetical protein
VGAEKGPCDQESRTGPSGKLVPNVDNECAGYDGSF